MATLSLPIWATANNAERNDTMSKTSNDFPTVEHNGRTYIEDEMILTDAEIEAIIRFEDDEDEMLAYEATQYEDFMGGMDVRYI